MISKQKEVFNKLADERFEKITELDKNVNPDNLIYRYKGLTADVKFSKFDNALNLLDKINEVKIRLADAKNDEIKFQSDLGEIKKKIKKSDQENKKTHYTILKCFIKQETILLNFSILFFDGI